MKYFISIIELLKKMNTARVFQTLQTLKILDFFIDYFYQKISLFAKTQKRVALVFLDITYNFFPKQIQFGNGSYCP